MRRLVPLIILLVLLPVASVLAGDLPQVLQPNTTAYSASEVAALTQAIATLTEALNDYDMGSRRYFSPNDWSSSDFAAYTAGVLAGKGYETKIVSGPGWPDGTHTWVLVGIALGSKTAWVPVEAAPVQGHKQQVLGRIPVTTDAAGEMWFDGRYVAFTEVVQLPPNIAPVARIRLSALTAEPGRNVKFLAVASFDPDGEIVLYQWDFGDGEVITTPSWSVLHQFATSGSFVITLRVVDNRGATTVTKASLSVPRDQVPQPLGGGCGCGG